MYLIGFSTPNASLCGNQAMLITHYKARHKIREAASRFAKMHKHSEVYGLCIFPQFVCEMDRAAYADYVRTHGVRLAGGGK